MVLERGPGREGTTSYQNLFQTPACPYLLLAGLLPTPRPDAGGRKADLPWHGSNVDLTALTARPVGLFVYPPAVP